MKKIILLFTLLSAILLFSFSEKSNIEVVKYPWLENNFALKNDTTYVYNFWATWCMPCVAELPAFEKINKRYQSKKVKVVLVSLDYVKKLNEVLIPFVKKKNIQSKVVLLNEPDGNTFIDKIDSNWSGALPATLIINNNTSFRFFDEKEFNFDSIDSIIKISFQKK